MSTPPIERPQTAAAVQIPAGASALTADLAIPVRARGLVILAHGAASNRLSARNRQLADILDRAGMATLVPDLLTPEEEYTATGARRVRFDMTLLASRLIAVWTWTQSNRELRRLPSGLFGAGSSAGAVLLAAAQQPRSFRAVVTGSGRPDFAGSALRRVMSPTLLIVGEHDEHSVDVNLRAAEGMLTDVRVEVVPGATHDFEEPGALARLGQLTSDWFLSHFIP